MRKYISIVFVVLSIVSCKKDKSNTTPTTSTTPTPTVTEIKGFSIMSKLAGIWNGPVNSPTPIGSFPEWIVDFRPISNTQISAKNELDSINDIFMSFFIAKHNDSLKVAFRNGGGFAGNQRVSYLVLDSVYEDAAHSYYRFVDFVAGKSRVYSEVERKADSLRITTYTNQYNSLTTPALHMDWRAVLKDTTSTQPALSVFSGYPSKTMTKDFNTTFDLMTESIYYNSTTDPYPEADQPYLGNTDIHVNISNPGTVDTTKKTIILITTQPLFSGFTFQTGNLKYRSRYVPMTARTFAAFNFNYMHPGDYYVNVIYDANGDLTVGSGDYINGSFDVPFTLAPLGSQSVNVNVNFQIP